MNFPMRKHGWSFGCLALVTALFVAAPAAAEKTVIDEDVTSWFESQAMDEIREISANSKTLEGEGFGALHVEEPQFGAILHVHTWTSEFLAGKEKATPTEPIDQWVAPLFDGGKVVGTIVAWRDPTLDNQVALAYFDDDVEAGLALAELSEETHLVLDPPLSSYFALEDGTIRALSGRGTLEIKDPMKLADYQELLVDRYSGYEHLDPKEGYAGGGPMVPSSVSRAELLNTRLYQIGFALLLAGLALFAFDAAKRRRNA